jgi:F-type H+-transporting ATPase subunit delta
MLNTSLSLRYARAFYKIATSLGNAIKVADDLREISRIIDNSGDIKRVLYHPGITPLEKKNVLDELFSKQCESVTLKFLGYLIDKKRILYLSAIAKCVAEMRDKDENRVNVKVESFTIVPGETMKKIKERMVASLAKNVVLTQEVVPSLMGGMRIILGDGVIDGSLSYQLKRMSETITSF